MPDDWRSVAPHRVRSRSVASDDVVASNLTRTEYQSRSMTDWLAMPMPVTIGRIIHQYAADIPAEYRRLLGLAIWDGGHERWRTAANPGAYLLRMIRNAALRTLVQEAPT